MMEISKFLFRNTLAQSKGGNFSLFFGQFYGTYERALVIILAVEVIRNSGYKYTTPLRERDIAVFGWPSF